MLQLIKHCSLLTLSLQEMRIEIITIDRSEVLQVGDTGLGYWGKFACTMVSGTAIIVPYSNREDSLVPGASLSVETSQEGVANFEILPYQRDHSIIPLEKAGDYRVIGTVDLSGDDEVFYIDAGGFTFTVDIDETKGIIPQKGDTVQFNLHSLTLWDENI